MNGRKRQREGKKINQRTETNYAIPMTVFKPADPIMLDLSQL